MPEQRVDATDIEQINAAITELAGVFAANHDENKYLTEPGRHGRTRASRKPVPVLDLRPRMQVKFLGDRRWWTVRAHNDAATVLTRTASFGGGLQYTVIVWAEGRRGPHVSWEHEALTDDGCARIAAAVKGAGLELSEKRAVCLDLEQVRAGR